MSMGRLLADAQGRKIGEMGQSGIFSLRNFGQNVY